MKHPEVGSQPSTFPAFADKIKYKYNGNYSQQMRLNPELLRKMHGIIGVPNKSFVIKDGNETPEGTEMHIIELGQGYGVKQRKPICEIKKTKNEVILTINSQVIDGRVQDEQRGLDKDKKSGEMLYQALFTTYLKASLAEGVSVWAFGELGRFPLWQKFLKGKELGKLLLEKRDLLVTIDGA